MTLFTFSAPATKDYADQADGNDWNRLINALTGSVAELFTFTRKLTLTVNNSEAGLVLTVTNPGRDGANITSTTSGDGTNAFGVYIANTLQNASATNFAAGLYVTSVKSGTGTATKKAGIWIDNGGGGTTTTNYGLYITAPSGGTTNWSIFAEGSSVIAANNIAPFSVPNSGLYITESSDNIARIYLQSNSAANRRKTIGVDNSNNFFIVDSGDSAFLFKMDNSGSMGIPSGQKIYLDGSALTGDTYIYESATNQVRLYTGGVNTFQADSNGAYIRAVQKAGAAVAGDSYDGFFTVLKDTSGSTVKLIYNDGGVLKSVTLS